MLNLLALLLWPGSQSLTPVTFASSPTRAVLGATNTAALVAPTRTSVTIP